MFIFTRQFLRDQRACYSDARIAELIPETGLSAVHVTDLPISAADRVWAMTRDGVLTPDQRQAFASGCAERAKGYADAAAYAYADAAAYADADAAADAAARAAAYATAAAYAATAAAYAAYAAARATARAAAAAAARAAAAEREAQIAHLRQLIGGDA